MGEREISEKALEEIYSNPENVKRIMESKTKDDVKEIFSEKGIELTQERYDFLKKIYSSIAKEIKKMPPEELEKISGGKVPFEKVAKAGLEQFAISGGLWVGIGFIEGIIEGAICESEADCSFKEKTKRIFKKAGVRAVSFGPAVGVVLGAYKAYGTYKLG